MYILEIKLLSVASSTDIFSQSVGCLFVLFIVPFAVQKLRSLIRFHSLSNNHFLHGHGLSVYRPFSWQYCEEFPSKASASPTRPVASKMDNPLHPGGYTR